MRIKRFFQHLFFTDWQASRAFSRASLDAIAQLIHKSEQLHGGEIRVAIEGGLDSFRLFRDQSPRERAIEVFSQLRVWDTENNTGVLIYIQLADEAVEIVADRGIHAKVRDTSWLNICQDMETHFSKSEFEKGALNGVAALADVIGRHFPANETFSNELPDVPVMLG